MTATTSGHRAGGRGRRGYGLRAVARMEWRKLRTVRSTWYIVAAFAAAMIGTAILALSHQSPAPLDPVHDTFIGLVLAQLLTGALGVLAITAEFSSGMIRATFAAAPRRPLVLAAKAAVAGAVTLAAGEIAAFAAFAVGQSVLTAPAPHAALGQPGVLRAVLLAGAYPALIALISLGIGAVIRNTAGALSAVAGMLFVLPLLIGRLSPAVVNVAQNFLPHVMANSMTAVRPQPHMAPPAVSFGLLCGYAAAALAAGAWSLARRDA
jgi:ABC-2 type transport system permease protein